VDRTAKLPEQLGADERARAVAGVDDHREVGVGDSLTVDGVEDGLPVGAASALDVAVGAGVVPRRVGRLTAQCAFDGVQRVASQFGPVASDEFDTVVRRGVVACSHHQARDCFPLAVRL